MPTTKPESDARGDNQQLDDALADTFPASDPPAQTSATSSLPLHAGAVAPAEAFLVISEAVAEKGPEEWRTCGQARWLSPNTPALMLALSPALALLDALVAHGLDREQRWCLAHLQFPADGMSRLDTPHEGWRQRTYRNEVRLAGDRWALQQQSPFLRVPSPRCPREYNLLVNLLHPQREGLHVVDVCPLETDLHLDRSES